MGQKCFSINQTIQAAFYKKKPIFHCLLSDNAMVTAAAAAIYGKGR